MTQPSAAPLCAARQAAEGLESPCRECGVHRLGFCSDLDPDDLAALSQLAGEIRLTAGDTLVAQGAPAHYVYTVRRGTLKQASLLPDGRSQVLSFPEAGDFLGFGIGSAHPAAIEAVTPANLCYFDRRRLDALVERTPPLRRRLLDMAEEYLAAERSHAIALGRLTARERVAAFLIERQAKARRRGEAGRRLQLPMPRADIAEYLGLTMETVSRSFTALKRDGLISPESGGLVELSEPAGLADLAQARSGEDPVRGVGVAGVAR